MQALLRATALVPFYRSPSVAERFCGRVLMVALNPQMVVLRGEPNSSGEQLTLTITVKHEARQLTSQSSFAAERYMYPSVLKAMLEWTLPS